MFYSQKHVPKVVRTQILFCITVLHKTVNNNLDMCYVSKFLIRKLQSFI